MPEPLVFLHGQFVPQSQAHLTLHDAGFVMGATVTDLCRTFQQRLYRWTDHVERFSRSCRAAEIYPDLSIEEMTFRAEELIVHNARLLPGDADLAVVLFATPGPIGYYLGEEGGGPVTFGMHTFPLPYARYRKLIGAGAVLVVPSVRQVPAVSVDPRIKMRSRMHWWLAGREAERIKPGTQALLLNEAGHVTETAAANLLVVRRGEVLSPPRDEILEGVSLGVVRELCGELDIPFTERPLTLHDCLNADEALLASTPYCLAPVAEINGRPLPVPGVMTRHLHSAWSARVGVDIWEQMGVVHGA